MTDLPLSGASPLPHLDRCRLQDCCAACHSGVAWVSKATFSVRVGSSTIATTPHDPLPHLDRCRLQDCCAACHSGGAWVSKAGFSVRVGFSAIAATPHDPCGRGLAPDSGGSGNTWLTDLPLSGASPLPHLDRCRLQDCCAACHSGGAWVSKATFSVRVGSSTIAATPHEPCGRGLAPDSGGSGNTWLTDLPLSG